MATFEVVYKVLAQLIESENELAQLLLKTPGKGLHPEMPSHDAYHVIHAVEKDHLILGTK